MIRAAVALAILASALAVRGAAADAPGPNAKDLEAEASRAFRSAQVTAAGDGPRAIERALDAFEAIGAARPIGRWTDDAWAEAARLAERQRDYARARRALDQVIEIGTDAQLVRRARAARARLDAATGAGTWDQVAARHEQLRAAMAGDPTAALDGLAQLVTQHPGYPRATAVRLAIAGGWERAGDEARALRWYREAAAHDPPGSALDAPIELVRALIRAGELDAADRELAGLAARAGTSRVVATHAQLDHARRRRWIRRGLWLGLAGLLVIALGATRSALGSLAATVRALGRPPAEVWFLIPVALALSVVALAADPVVARAVREISLGGVAIAWCSGAWFDAVRRARGRIGGGRAAGHAVVAVVAVALVAYLAIDRDRLAERVGETWRAGPN